MTNCRQNVADLTVQPEPGTSQRNQPQPEAVRPQGNPLGNYPYPIRQSLYKHVPQATREKARLGQFVEYKSFLVDPFLPLKSQKLSLVRDPDTGNFDWVEKSTVKEISSFDQWLKAHTVYAAMLVDARPEKALELVKYQNLIHDSSLRYEWDAVLLYDFHFRQAMSEDPTLSWGISDPELYTQVFTDRGIQRTRGFCWSGKKNPKPCNQYNLGNCTWRKCRFTHKCSMCQRTGHPATQCHTLDHPQQQQAPQGNQQNPPTHQEAPWQNARVTQPSA